MVPVRVDAALGRRLDGLPDRGELCPDPGGPGPAFSCALEQPLRTAVAMRVTARTRAGIPLASAVVTLEPGAARVSVPALPLLAMEGYAHLKADERQGIARRVWARCGYVTLEVP